MVEDREEIIATIQKALRHYPKKGYTVEASSTRADIICIRTPDSDTLIQIPVTHSLKDTVYKALSSIALELQVENLNDVFGMVETNLSFKPFTIPTLVLGKVPKNQLQFRVGFEYIFIDISRKSYINIQNYLHKNKSDVIPLSAICKNLTNRENIKLLLKLTTFANACAN